MRIPRRTRPAIAVLALGLGATSARAADNAAEKQPPAVTPAKPGGAVKGAASKDVKATQKAGAGKGASDVKLDGIKDAPSKGAKVEAGKGASDVKVNEQKYAPSKGDKPAVVKGGVDQKDFKGGVDQKGVKGGGVDKAAPIKDKAAVGKGASDVKAPAIKNTVKVTKQP